MYDLLVMEALEVSLVSLHIAVHMGGIFSNNPGG